MVVGILVRGGKKGGSGRKRAPPKKAPKRARNGVGEEANADDTPEDKGDDTAPLVNLSEISNALLTQSVRCSPGIRTAKFVLLPGESNILHAVCRVLPKQLLPPSDADIIAPSPTDDDPPLAAAAAGYETYAATIVKGVLDVVIAASEAEPAAAHAGSKKNSSTKQAALLMSFLNAKNVMDQTPLFIACDNGYAALVEALVCAGIALPAGGEALLTTADTRGETPLHKAAFGGSGTYNGVGRRDCHAKCILNLVSPFVTSTIAQRQERQKKLAAIIGQQNVAGWTAFHCASKGNHGLGITILLQILADSGLFFSSPPSRGGGSGSVGERVVNALCKQGETALHIAARDGLVESISAFVTFANANAATCPRILNVNSSAPPYHATPLMRAVVGGHLGAVAALLTSGGGSAVSIDVLYQDRAGNTALHHAVLSSCHVDIISALVEHLNRDPDRRAVLQSIKNMDGKTPLDLASDKHDQRIVALLSSSV